PLPAYPGPRRRCGQPAEPRPGRNPGRVGAESVRRPSAARQVVEVVPAFEVEPGPRDVVLALVVDLDPPRGPLLLVVDVGVDVVALFLAVRLQLGAVLHPADLGASLVRHREDLVAVAAGDVLVAVRRGVPALTVDAGRRAV